MDVNLGKNSHEDDATRRRVGQESAILVDKAVRSLRSADAGFVADVVIIGGGAAGCVVASRLTENPSINVAIIEAGSDTPSNATPADIRDVFPRSYANPNYFWPLKSIYQKGSDPAWYPQARVMGGGSSVMGMWALRGIRADFDAWEEAGAAGWAFDDLLPFFKKLEKDLDFSDANHGDNGPIPISRPKRPSWCGFTEALGKAVEKRGLPFLPDLNGTDADGLFEGPFSNDGKRRFSSANGYLTDQVRRRANLKIMTDTQVTEIAMSGRTARGVHVRRTDSSRRFIEAKWIIVSAGAIFSPALLMRTGFGPAADLAALGITPIADNAHIGKNLHNHPYVYLGAVVRPEARHDPNVRSYALGCVRLSTNYRDAPSSDIFLSLISRSGPRARDTGLGTISISLYEPFSRGSVKLSNNSDQPHVDFALLEDERDKARLAWGARFARGLLTDEAVKPTVHETFVLPVEDAMRSLSMPGPMSGLYSFSMATLLNLNAGARRYILSKRLGENRFLDFPHDDKSFDEIIISSATSMAHPGGTCALGNVVDSSTALKGAENIFVADASIMPKVPRANTNIATVMVGEKAAFEIRRAIQGK